MKYQIILEILFLLLSKKRVNASELAKEYGLSRRTIMRYIQTIELAGIPVYSEKGRYGGFFIADSFNLNAGLLSKQEIGIITDLLNCLKQSVGLKQAEILKNKIIALSKIKGEDLNDSTNRIIVIDEDKRQGDLAEKLLCAINSCKQAIICISRQNGDLQTKTVEPHALILKGGKWYLLCYCAQNGFLTIKLTELSQVYLCNETFTRKSYAY